MKRLRINESHIKALVLNELKAQGRICRSATIASEFLLGRTGIRADLAIWADRFIGIEIKSELDSLRRLSHQLQASRRNFEETILVVAGKHSLALEAFDTTGVSIWVMDAGGSLRLHSADVWDCEINWGGLLNQRDLAPLGATEDAASQREQFSKFFRKRFGPYSDAFWGAVGKRRITPDDLKYLSRFRDKREGALRLKMAEEQQWEAWKAFGEMDLEMVS